MKRVVNSYRSSLILLASMILGGLLGFVWGPEASKLQPIADTFLNLLYCSVVPLVFFSLSSAIAKMQNLSKLVKIMGSFFLLTFATGIISSLFMLLSTFLVNPSSGVSIALNESVDTSDSNLNILGMFTVNDFPNLFSRNHLMALIVFTIIFAIGLIQVGEKGKPVVALMETLTDVIVKVIGIIMKLAPLGLGAYFAILIGTNGSEVIGSLSKAVGLYLVVLVIYFIFSQTFAAYVSAGFWGVKKWWSTCIPVLLTALGTSSSAASIPVNLDHAKKIGISDEIADLVIPLGATLHKDGACLIQIVKIVVLSSLFNIDFFTPQHLFMAVLISVMASIVVGGIPGGGYVAEIFIISAFGFPAEAIPIMVLLGTVTDAPATALNVTGDTGLAMMIARIVDGKNWMIKKEQTKTL
ncbi:dicarboxylate/amino acid:cation symporter [Streptococcus marimammalium]|uniref:dicarboxylate/amino acid:cation symporter n=1 Tax=Streptococcus marimammalium TaxID=269666 RepID=UPI00036461D6|nr:dicarboxylate/amino acid:cation symporter [Streptococcus marimammalium]